MHTVYDMTYLQRSTQYTGDRTVTNCYMRVKTRRVWAISYFHVVLMHMD